VMFAGERSPPVLRGEDQNGCAGPTGSSAGSNLLL
jgi:hypothetical protein